MYVYIFVCMLYIYSYVCCIYIRMYVVYIFVCMLSATGVLNSGEELCDSVCDVYK